MIDLQDNKEPGMTKLEAVLIAIGCIAFAFAAVVALEKGWIVV